MIPEDGALTHVPKRDSFSTTSGDASQPLLTPESPRCVSKSSQIKRRIVTNPRTNGSISTDRPTQVADFNVTIQKILKWCPECK